MEADDRVTHADQVSFLLARHGSATTALLRDALAAIDYTPRQADTLCRLAAGNGRMGQQALCERISVDPSVLVGILNDLEDAGLVERRRDPADRRRHIVAITERGQLALSEISTVLVAVERELFADLSSDEIVALRALLARVRTRSDPSGCTE